MDACRDRGTSTYFIFLRLLTWGGWLRIPHSKLTLRKKKKKAQYVGLTPSGPLSRLGDTFGLEVRLRVSFPITGVRAVLKGLVNPMDNPMALRRRTTNKIVKKKTKRRDACYDRL